MRNQGEEPHYEGTFLKRIPTILEWTRKIVREMEANARVSVAEELACVAPAGGDAAVERVRAKLLQIIADTNRAHLVPPMTPPVRLSVKTNW